LTKQAYEIWGRLKTNVGAMIGLTIIVLVFLVAAFSGFVLDYKTQVIGQNIMERLQPPSLQHFLGTDELGRDLFFRILYGTRYSLLVGIGSVAAAMLVGVTLGAVAGYYGGRKISLCGLRTFLPRSPVCF